jgi:2,3-bisphosphoglycerate-independent phosphoglycerate mutase
MKYIIVIADGMADFPVESLDNKTPMEYAYAPNMNYLAKHGQIGLMKTIFEQLPVGSIVANLGILSYDPHAYHPHGRASFEALAQGISINSNDIAFRCNLISLSPDKKKITDFTAGNISDGHAKNIISHMKLTNKNIELIPGQSYRGLLIYRNANISPAAIKTHEPHCNIGSSIDTIMPSGKTAEGADLAKTISTFLSDSIEQINQLNLYFKTKADMLWVWSPSSKPELPNFYDKFNLSGAIVASMDFLKGIGASAQMHFEDIPDTNGYIDTNYRNKLTYAKRFIDAHDLVYIHVNAPDEEGHKKDPFGKVKAIEHIDNQIIGPLVLHLREKYANDFRIAVLPDHYTAVKDGHHYAFDVPFLIYGKDIPRDEFVEFSENEAKKSPVHLISFDFLKYFIGS